LAKIAWSAIILSFFGQRENWVSTIAAASLPIKPPRCQGFQDAGSHITLPLLQAESESARIFAAQCKQICASLVEEGTFTEVIRQHLLQLPNQIASLENIAVEYLKTTALTIDEVAVRLGYADAPSFSHAFKRWTGKSPGALRARRQAGSA